MPFRVGSGHDVHALVEGRSLVLGGVLVPSAVGFDTHSDGDVLSHALVDALAGAIADGDLGTHFPEDDPEAQDARSLDFLKYMVNLVRSKGTRLRTSIRSWFSGPRGCDHTSTGCGATWPRFLTSMSNKCR